MKVSILSANFNNAKFLRQYFDSLLSSSLRDFEIVFVDDCSTDNSLEIAKDYANRYPFIRLIELKANVGFANALNIGVRSCAGEFVARLDPDDWVSGDRLERQIDAFLGDPCIDVVGSQAQYFNSDTNQLLHRTNMPTSGAAIEAAFLRADNGVLHGTTMIRSSLLKKFEYRQNEVPSEDYGLFLRMFASGAIFFNINQPLTFVRIHGASVSNVIKYSTIEKCFFIRAEVLGISFSKVSILRVYLMMYFYRRAMASDLLFVRVSFLAIASLFGVDRVLRKIKSLYDKI